MSIAAYVSKVCADWFGDEELHLLDKKAGTLGLAQTQWEPCVDEWRLSPRPGKDRLSDLYSRLRDIANQNRSEAIRAADSGEPWEIKVWRMAMETVGKIETRASAESVVLAFHGWQAERSRNQYGEVDRFTVRNAVDAVRLLGLDEADSWALLGRIVGEDVVVGYRAHRVELAQLARANKPRLMAGVKAIIEKAERDEKKRGERKLEALHA